MQLRIETTEVWKIVVDMFTTASTGQSQRAVVLLLGEGNTRTKIARMAGTNVVVVRKIENGEKAFTTTHLTNLRDTDPNLFGRVLGTQLREMGDSLIKSGTTVGQTIKGTAVTGYNHVTRLLTKIFD